jgi:hypothetical protein
VKAFFQRVFTDKGLLLVIGAGLLLTFYYFGTLVTHPGSRYFGAAGDGMQIYYQTEYHVKYDSLWWQQQSMNYPDKESIFFTGALPLYTNVMKVFGPGAAHTSVAVLNLFMLFSPLFGAVFLYALFRHWNLPWWYGALCGVGIMFCSPQLERMCGHYSLAMGFIIPALIFSLARFYDYPRIRLSLFTALLVFFAATTHLYLLVFCLFALGIYWFILFITRDRGFGRFKFALLHFSLQVVLPVLLTQLLVMVTDHENDRTSIPWGFDQYTATWSSVFYPYSRFYEPYVSDWFLPKHGSYESIAYIGVAAVLGLVVVLFVQAVRLFRLRFDLLLSVSDKKVLNILAWTSLLLMFLSFGWPFLFKEDGSWIGYAGPFRQFRALGRFTWMFFYVTNILAVYRLWKLVEHRTGNSGKILRWSVMVVIPALLFIDTWGMSASLQERLNNRIVELDDEKNLLTQNAWLRKINTDDYQAILPLPYFHNGSEGPGLMPANHAIINITYIVSLKTGLPMLSMLSGRSSLSKSAEHIAMVKDPVAPLSLLTRFPDKRPLLVLARKDELSANEAELLALSDLLFETPEYTVHRLYPAKMQERIWQQYAQHHAAFEAQKTWPAWPYLSTDSVVNFSCRDFEELNEYGPPFRGKKSMKVYGGRNVYNVIYDAKVTGAVPGNYSVTFWFGNFDKDLYARSFVEVASYTGDKLDTAVYANMSEACKAISGHWSLEEKIIPIKHPEQRIKVTVMNFDLAEKSPIYIDELLIKPEQTQLFDVQKDSIQHNNRTYYRKQ